MRHHHSISGLVVEYILAIAVTRVRFPADAGMGDALGRLEKLGGGTGKDFRNLA